MRIGELARRTGLSPDTLRFYEKAGLITPKYYTRLESGYRNYSDEIVEHLGLIKGAQAAGFTLREIGLLFTQWGANSLSDADIATHLHNKLDQINLKIAELQQVQCYIEQKICSVTGVSAVHADSKSART